MNKPSIATTPSALFRRVSLMVCLGDAFRKSLVEGFFGLVGSKLASGLNEALRSLGVPASRWWNARAPMLFRRWDGYSIARHFQLRKQPCSQGDEISITETNAERPTDVGPTQRPDRMEMLAEVAEIRSRPGRSKRRKGKVLPKTIVVTCVLIPGATLSWTGNDLFDERAKRNCSYHRAFSVPI